MAAAEVDIVIRNGTLVTPAATFVGDVAARDGEIVLLGRALEVSAQEEIDATGLYVLPGGIDPHTHFDTDAGDLGRTADDYESGTRAAIAGGVTTVLNYGFPTEGQTLTEVVEREIGLARTVAHTDYSIQPVVTPLAVGDLDAALRELVAQGFPSIKIFTGSQFRLPERDVVRVLAAAGAANVVVAVHPEDEALTEQLISAHRLRGTVEPEDAAMAFAACHSPATEAIPITQVSGYAVELGATVYFVHLSSRAALEALRYARDIGASVYGETRPAYLFLDRSKYELPGREGAKFICLPPLREFDDQRALWDALSRDDLQTVGSDHTSWMAKQKIDRGADFAAMLPGFSGVQTWYGMLFAEGVTSRQMTVERFVEVSSSNAAKIFGLWPKKGALQVGSDADFTIVDPKLEVSLIQGAMQSKSDYDPYVGFSGRGWPSCVLSRGEVVYRDGVVESAPGRGRLVPRQTSAARASH